MIQKVILPDAESALGTKASANSWAECRAGSAAFWKLGTTMRPRCGIHYYETKYVRNWRIYRSYWAFQTAYWAKRYPIVSCQLRLWVRTLDVDLGAMRAWLYAGPLPPGEVGADTTGWLYLSTPLLYDPDSGDDIPLWDPQGDGQVDSQGSAGMNEGAYIYLDLPERAWGQFGYNADPTKHEGFTWLRMYSNREGYQYDPGVDADPELNYENYGRYVEFDGTDDDHPPALLLELDLEENEMAGQTVYIDGESRQTVTITRRADDQSGDGDWSDGSPTTIAEKIVVDLQPITAKLREQTETGTGYPETAEYVLIPEEPLPMGEHGESPGIKVGDDVTLLFETGNTLDFEIVGIPWLHAGHQEIMLRQKKEET